MMEHDVPSLQTLTTSKVLDKQIDGKQIDKVLGEQIDYASMNLILRNLLDEPIGKTVYEQKKLEEARKMFLEDEKLLPSFLVAKHALRTLQPEDGIYYIPKEVHAFLEKHYHPLVQDIHFELAQYLANTFWSKGERVFLDGTRTNNIKQTRNFFHPLFPISR